jgi:hypothetical protein
VVEAGRLAGRQHTHVDAELGEARRSLETAAVAEPLGVHGVGFGHVDDEPAVAGWSETAALIALQRGFGAAFLHDDLQARWSGPRQTSLSG